jgi:PST family polysaccharide transporter
MATTVMGLFRIFKEAGLSTATVQREGVTHAQVSNLFWINIAVSGVISVCVAASAPAVAWFYRDPRLVTIMLALAGTFVLTGSTVQHMALLNRQMRFKAIAVVQIASVAAGVAVGIAMAWLKYGYWSLVGSQLVTSLLAGILAWTYSRWRPQLFVRRSGTRPLVRFGFDLAAGGFIWSLAQGVDALAIGRYYGPNSVGLYSRALALLARPLEQSISPVEAVFVPTLSLLQSQPERYRRSFLTLFETVVLASCVLGGLLLPLARPVTLLVLGARWEKAAVIFAACAAGAIFFPTASVSTWLFASLGRGRDALRLSSLASVITVCAYLAGLPFGPAGVAIAYSAASVLIILPITFRIAGRSGPVSTRDLWVSFIRQLPVWGVVCGATFAVHTLVTGLNPFYQCVICGLFGLLAGAGFFSVYAPSRKVAAMILVTIKELKKGQECAPTASSY